MSHLTSFEVGIVAISTVTFLYACYLFYKDQGYEK
jgi:hypothetical protein